ncbi:dissimilatory sulfite reductase (desulfoviridin) subunit gamma [gamma proteobacterium BDW918]|jgi:tRNA 2-thiouridine synthesizing protein E|uniref:Sulfurtransferase n=1 Tax=Zhongshania aliphaticivorans TaxID=1470434 RepID=A0A127M5M9_9GAMM|nr:TusE/DsrC/DsvC family sulfur relay protein [Zhongshania aliphaticivorans]AMO68540.1 sulfur relay protein TusE [Zhongshania aliphaticivorans]EIF43230.1 dissimilatory sulfite reductase (desulfoviridin) subunit gamma [gamma proteobacterium BDW918]|tara:strand:- start:442 stop:777 length:336 start_codon:yes stop_codon:yes gene_type:complete
MAAIIVNGCSIATDPDGFLKDLKDWSPAVAEELAAEADIKLSDSHWQLIQLVQHYYQQFGLSPAMRPLIKYAKLTLGDDKGNSLYFLKHFPGSPAKLLSKIAGLPRPDNCL